MFSDISAMFPEPDKTKTILKEIFNIEKDQRFNIDEVALALQHAIRRDRHKRHMMMAFLVNLAFADGHLSHAEENLLLKIAAFLHFTHDEIESMIRQAGSRYAHATSESSLEDACKLLDVSADDSMDVIKKKYRKLVRQYHPDIIKAQGKSDDYIEEATEKVQQINAAYEMVKKAKSA
jgi:DnaJ like chaperone protein